MAKLAKKVLIMEPNDCAFLGVSHVLREALNVVPEHVPNCDTAIHEIRQSLKKSTPYDFLITEYAGARQGNYTRALLKEANGIQPKLRTILYTGVARPLALKSILHEPGVNGCVLKSGNGSSQLVKAIRSVDNSGFYLSPNVDDLLSQVQHISLDEYDFNVLNALSEGLSQREIANLFVRKKVHPSSLSSIEKKINQLKDRFHAKNNVHLIARASLLGAL